LLGRRELKQTNSRTNVFTRIALELSRTSSRLRVFAAKIRLPGEGFMKFRARAMFLIRWDLIFKKGPPPVQKRASRFKKTIRAD
jgi:hypothetical protein